MKLIDKDHVVAEIKKRIKGLKDCHADTVAGYAGEISGLERLLSFLDTLEVKEVDLKEEIYNAEKRFGDIDEMGGYRILLFDDEFRDVLRYFFELGLKAQKGE